VRFRPKAGWLQSLSVWSDEEWGSLPLPSRVQTWTRMDIHGNWWPHLGKYNHRLIRHSLTNSCSSPHWLVKGESVKICLLLISFWITQWMKLKASWAITPCTSFVDVDRRFRGAYCLHHQGDESLSRSRRPELIHRLRWLPLFPLYKTTAHTVVTSSACFVSRRWQEYPHSVHSESCHENQN
jgi:hypothetical protein